MLQLEECHEAALAVLGGARHVENVLVEQEIPPSGKNVRWATNKHERYLYHTRLGRGWLWLSLGRWTITQG